MADTLVLRGHVHDALKAQRIVHLAEAFSGGKKAINMMRIDGAQQVMLEVKVAEVSKTLLDELGVDMNLTRSIGNTSVTLLSQLLTAGSTTITTSRPNGQTNLTLTAEMKKGLVKVLAEPTITAVNGQEGSFLAGGRIYIPVPQLSANGAASITLEEKEFGVGLKFTPTVLDGTRVNLKLVSEVSELAQTGSPFTTVGGITSVLPSITSRRVDTTVQLNDGQSFAIAGLIKNNMTETISRFPGLGEIPVLGALFRSTEFQKDQSELIFVVTPRLVRPMVKAGECQAQGHEQALAFPPRRRLDGAGGQIDAKDFSSPGHSRLLKQQRVGCQACRPRRPSCQARSNWHR